MITETRAEQIYSDIDAANDYGDRRLADSMEAKLAEELEATAAELYATFTQINKDASDSHEDGAVPFSDIEYYATEIENVYEVSERFAETLAKELAKFSEKQNT